jgi:3',5'-cyclic AMP phosphodiesterase CpdA
VQSVPILLRASKITTLRALSALALLLAVVVPGAHASGRAPLIAAAGDIACPPNAEHFNRGEGAPRHCRQERTSRLLFGRGYRAILPLGDLINATNSTLESFQRAYGPSWGVLRRKTFPVPGNHEFDVRRGRGYFNYFNGRGERWGRAGERGHGWYSYELGSWHMIALNSACGRVPCGPRSRQLRWLRRDLQRHRSRCTLAYFHHPLFSSGAHGDDQDVRPFWRALYRAGADVVLNGHDHHYERFAPQDPRGRLDRRRGIVEFIVGTGGHSLFGVRRHEPHSRRFQNSSFGVLRLRLGRDSFRWRYLLAPGARIFDQGRRRC